MSWWQVIDRGGDILAGLVCLIAGLIAFWHAFKAPTWRERLLWFCASMGSNAMYLAFFDRK